MFFNTWRKYLRELSHSLLAGRRPRSVRHRAPSFKPGVTVLEDRLAPAAAFALSGTNLIVFDTVDPGTTQLLAITNVNGSETLVGIDFRPQNGHLYGLGVNSTSNTGTLYNISTRTGFATPLGATGQIAFVDAGASPVDLPDPATVGYGVDFNPAADRFRVVVGSVNFRVDPNTGAPIDGDLGGAPGAVSGINADGPISGNTTLVDATAYTNNQPNTNLTTQYTLNAATDTLYIQNPPNAGTQTTVAAITLAGNPLDFTNINGFDIPAGINVSTSGNPVASGSAFAALNVGGNTGLYSIDLTDGEATFHGFIGTGLASVQGLAVQSKLAGAPIIELGGNGTVLIRSNTAQANAGTQVTIEGVNGSETVVGIDFRPATGQLFGLGVNAAGNTATLYLIDPQITSPTTPPTIVALATPVGSVGLIAFQDGAGNPVDLPDPATTGYGFDFNPTVDLIRVVTSSGLNFRVSPTTGAPQDGNLGGAAGSVANTNTDANINGSGSTGVSGAAYTNSFGQTTGVNGPTTQYTLDATQNMLFIQFPPNSGMQTAGVPVTLNGAPLDFLNAEGFDIPGNVQVAVSGTQATGFGYASLTVLVGMTPVSEIFRINLATGAATDLGPAATALQGLAVGEEPEITDLRITKTDNVTAVAPGSQVTYTITVTNVGTLSVTGATVTDTFAFLTGATYTAVQTGGATGFTANGAGNISDVVNMPAFSSITYTVSATVGANVPGLLSNTATVTTPVLDSNPGDNSATDTDLAGDVAFAATTDNRLLRFFVYAPTNLLSDQAITGLNMGETIAGMDFRPVSNVLYALTTQNRVYTINPATAAATLNSAANIDTNLFLAGSPAGTDFNPQADAIRLVNANNDNVVYSQNNTPPTTTQQTDLSYIATDPNVGVDPNIVASAYDRNDTPPAGPTPTTLFGIDSTLNTLVRQGAVDGNAADVAGGGSPGGGLLTTLGNLGVNPTDLVGFDISGIGAGGNGLAVAAMQLQGDAFSRLYSINLTNPGAGAASLIGAIGAGNVLVTALAVSPQAGVPFTDDFNRANSANLGSNWTTQSGAVGVNNNMGTSDPNAVSIATLNTSTFTDVSVGEDVINVLTNGARAGLIARYTGTGEFNSNFYLGMLWKNIDTGVYEAFLFLKQNGNPAYQQLGTTVDLTGIFTGTGSLRFEVVGNQLKLFVNGVLRLVAYDSTVAAGGQVGVRAQASNFDNFSVGAVQLLPAVLPFTDQFTHANNSNLDRDWTERSGAFSIQGNAALATTIVPSASLATLNTTALADAIVRADVVLPANGSYAGLVARATGTDQASSSFYLAVVDNVGGVFTAYLFRKLAGSGFVQLASANVTALLVVPGVKTLRFEALGNQLKLYINNGLQLVAYDSMIATPGQVGMRGFNASFDNFNALAAPPINVTPATTDNFNNPANEPDLDRTWTERVGAFSTQNDNAATAVPGISLATLNTAPLTNSIIDATVNITPIGSYAGIVARYSGPADDNYYLAVLFNNGGNYEAYLFKKQNGAFTQLSFQALPVNSFTGIGLLNFTLAGNLLELRVNGTLRGAAVDSSGTPFTTGLVGMRASGASLDDFTVQ